jgi:quinol-cytochrome oxidoreductase complex cytochrome b subunit
MNYTATEQEAFKSINKIIREIKEGWLIRNIHKNGAMMILILVVIHIYRGLIYTSYSIKKTWIIGIIIYFILILIGFLGYTLPYGQMSYWGRNCNN